MSRNALMIVVLVVTCFSSRAMAQANLTEWPLSPTSSIWAIDASEGPPIALGDTGNQCLAEFDGAVAGAVFTRYCSPALPFVPGDDLRVLVMGASDRYLWMTERVNRRLARLHTTTASPYYDIWTLPPGEPEPRWIDLDRSRGNVIFAAFDLSTHAFIGSMTPGVPTATIIKWDVSSVVTTGKDEITGLAFHADAASSYAVFTVFGLHRGVGILDLMKSQLQFWDVELVARTRVAVDSSGHAVFSHDGTTSTVDILDWAGSQYKSWVDGLNSLSADVTVDRRDSPLFTAQDGSSFNVVAVDTSGPWAPRATPPWMTVDPERFWAFWDRIDPVISRTIVPRAEMVINTMIGPLPFTHYTSTNGKGAISADLTSPLDIDVWFWEKAPRRLARITPL